MLFKHMLLALTLLIMTLAVEARPVLQPEVKEYCKTGGTFESSALSVFYQDQAQCAIAADETSVKGGKLVWDGGADSEKGVYIAIADSEAGRKLVVDFSLDVPLKAQGYAIAAENGRVAIVGHDPVGTLYGAVTFAQMARSGMVEAARVRDWPDVLYRTDVSFGRGLWNLGHGEKTPEGRAAAIKEGLDLMLRYKMNMFCDLFWVKEGSPERELEFYRQFGKYAADRGIYYNHYSTTAVYNRRTYPKGKTFDEWPCVKNHYSWEDTYYCWADDAMTEAAANRCVDYLRQMGMERCVINIHPVDSGFWRDPEDWSRRCEKCRARWNDHERWKASVNQYNIWIKVLRERIPSAVIGSCIYPYTFNVLLKPENERVSKWKESMPEYWDKLDKGLVDKDFYFSSWITTPDVIREVRKLVPGRPFHFSDTYPNTAGIFATYHRKIGSSCEGGLNFATTQGQECYLQLETLILSAEYLWDLKAPGAETFDGYTYYDGPNDHRGPEIVMTNSLVRICRTLYGDKLAPFMHRVLSSGVMPKYIAEPAVVVKYWNNVRRDPQYDPTQPEKSKDVTQLKYAPITDTPELMFSQVCAAEMCVKALAEGEGHLQGLGSGLRKYFMHFAKYAPFWLAAARTHFVVRQANARMSEGDNAGALEVLKEGRVTAMRDYDYAEKTFARLKGEADTSTNPSFAADPKKVWALDRKWAEKTLSRAEASAKVTLAPRKIGRKVKLGIHRGTGDVCAKMYFDAFENVEAKFFDSISLAELDRFDCILLSSRQYDKADFFANVKAYVEKGGGGVLITGVNCGNVRFDISTPFPEIVETAPQHVENFKRTMKFSDGRQGETMYVDYFSLKPGPKGEVLAYGLNDNDVLAVRGVAGLGKVVFLGTFNVASFNGNDYATREDCPLFGANAEITREAVEYFTGVRLKTK